MQISVTGQQIDVGDALRGYVEKRLAAGIEKYFDKPINARVVFSHDGSRFRTRVRVHVGKDMEWESDADEMDIHLSFNVAVEHIEKQLRRFKRRKRDHHRDHHNADEE